MRQTTKTSKASQPKAVKEKATRTKVSAVVPERKKATPAIKTTTAARKTTTAATAVKKTTAARNKTVLTVSKTTITARKIATVVSKNEALFKPKELEQFRVSLIEERERLKQELEEIEARAARALEIEAAGETGDYDDHDAADMASETFEREKDLAIAENTAALIAKVHTALDKLDKGTYGICDICNKQIKRARLEVIPFATLCIDCQGRVEVG